MSLLVTCDCGGWQTPSRLRAKLEGTRLDAPAGGSFSSDSNASPLRLSGTDRAAYLAARKIATVAGANLICNPFRPELIHVGRSLHHRNLFSPIARQLPEATRDAIMDEVYRPYRKRVAQTINEMLSSFPYVVHLSVRTFDAKTTKGKWRRGDMGLLYDPSCPDEVDWCLDLIDELYETAPELKVRRNHPTRGTNDSLPKSMRKRFENHCYLGIEIALNRAWVSRPVTRREQTLVTIGKAVQEMTPELAQRAA